MPKSARALTDRLSRLFRYDTALAEVASLGNGALDDVGITRDALARTVTAPGAVTDRMLVMAARHGVTADHLAGHTADVAGMVESCRSCASVGACRAYLSDPAESPARAVFCPNHVTYDALREGRR